MTQKPHNGSPPRELEIKLAVDKRADAARGLPKFLRGDELAPPVTRRLRTIYFDTPSHDLRSHQVSLRVREVDGAWRQTVKSETRIKGGLSHPYEVEVDVAGPEPDLRAITNARLRKRVRKIIGVKPLKRVFETDVRRTTQLVSGTDGSQVEIAFDDAEIKTAKDNLQFTELELELKRGQPNSLMEVVRLLAENNVPIRPSNHSKAERGYRLLLKENDVELKPKKLKPSGIVAGQKASDAFRSIVQSTVAQILHNWCIVLHGSDPEGPHQLRVGIRFLRTLLRAFRPAIDSDELRQLERDLRDLALTVGELRDLDVLSLEVVGKLDRPQALANGFEELVKDLVARRERLRATVRDVLRSPPMQTLQIRLALLPDQLDWEHVGSAKRPGKRKVESVARIALDKSWRRARLPAKRIDKLSIEERHDLRKKLKSLRYTVDAFSPLYKQGKCRRFIRKLKELQNLFGYLNDATRAGQLYDRGGTSEVHSHSFQQAIGYVAGYHAANSAVMWRDAKQCWSELVAHERPWA